MPDLLKIGFTTRHPRERAKELKGTNVPGSFVVEFAALVERPRDIERDVQEHLSSFGLNVDKEWFRCDVGVAIWSIRRKTPGEISEWYSDELDEARIEAEIQQALYRKRLADRDEYEDDQRRKNEKQEISECLDCLCNKHSTKSAEVAGKHPDVFDYRAELEVIKLHCKVIVGLFAFWYLYVALGFGLTSELDRWELTSITLGMGSMFGASTYLIAVLTGAISFWHRNRAAQVEARQQEILLPVRRMFPHLDKASTCYQEASDPGKRPGFLAPIPGCLQKAIGGEARVIGEVFSGTISNSTHDCVITLAVIRIPLAYQPCSFRVPICVLPGEAGEFELSVDSTELDREAPEKFSWNIHQIYGYTIA